MFTLVTLFQKAPIRHNKWQPKLRRMCSTSVCFHPVTTVGQAIRDEHNMLHHYPLLYITDHCRDYFMFKELLVWSLQRQHSFSEFGLPLVCSTLVSSQPSGHSWVGSWEMYTSRQQTSRCLRILSGPAGYIHSLVTKLSFIRILHGDLTYKTD